MPRPPKIIKKVFENKISLYLRKDNPVWQCGFTLNGHHIRKTTKCSDFEEAKEAAIELYLTARVRAKEGLPTVTKTFSSVAEQAKHSMEKALEAGIGKVTYNSYISVIDNYLVPFFGKRHIDKIDHAALQEYANWRREKFGSNPAHSTINIHNTALNRVFDAALERGYITKSQIPELKNDGEKAVRRPTFSLDEYSDLIRYMRKWVTSGKKGLITQKREIIRDYVYFISNTGIRPGTETAGLKWQHIHLETIEGVEYIFINVNGKTGPREVNARHGITRYLRRLLHRQTKFKDMDLREALANRLDAFVFALPDGTEVKNLIRPFAKMLDAAKLRIDPLTGEERTLYSMRHFYITRALIRGTSHEFIAKQCGTSSAMITKHYSHVTAKLVAKHLAGSPKHSVLQQRQKI